MTTLEQLIQEAAAAAINDIYGFRPEAEMVQLQETRKEFSGDLTLVVFPFLKHSKMGPEATADTIGKALQGRVSEVVSYNVIKGFLNLEISDSYWLSQLETAWKELRTGHRKINAPARQVMVEYSSPNTNKPLHLGHIRNNLLGYSIAELFKAVGNRVIKTNIVNDRGIHICKSMVAWQQWGDGKTPENTGIKGDHLVGELYVAFDKHYKAEISALEAEGRSRKEAEDEAPSILEAREMLRKWEAGDPETVELWRTMNRWVYAGFDETYRRLGVDFDKIYYESETYLVGKEEVLRGLQEGIFYRKEDGSVWADLTGDGLDHKLLLRSDGTSVYMTQDIGTAKMRYNDFPIDEMIYVVGNEQNYHFQVLSVLLDRLGYAWGKDLHHFSYGMVELPSGKMKSREGTVVDADDLIAGMVEIARKMAAELGKLEELTEEEAAKTHEMIALGALKYFMLKVDPKKNMLFNPEESIDFNGNTGPFIQYTHARVQSLLRKAAAKNISLPESFGGKPEVVSAKEKELMKRIVAFPDAVQEAAAAFSPALIANYCYELAKEYNQFYYDHPILNEADTDRQQFRLMLSESTGQTIRAGMKLLGINVPDRM